MPLKAQEFTHRNGRTARMHADGTAFVLQWQEESVPDFIAEVDVIEEMAATKRPKPSNWKTLFISGGRKDKISKGDIAGLFMKQGQLSKDELGMIELKQDCAFVAVKASKVKDVIQKILQSTRHAQINRCVLLLNFLFLLFLDSF
mgnify:CR=1 FL=1